jgi:hypothetical protein
MTAIILLAEIFANGMDVEYSDGVLYLIGHYDRLPLSFQLELAEHQSELIAAFEIERVAA